MSLNPMRLLPSIGITLFSAGTAIVRTMGPKYGPAFTAFSALTATLGGVVNVVLRAGTGDSTALQDFKDGVQNAGVIATDIASGTADVVLAVPMGVAGGLVCAVTDKFARLTTQATGALVKGTIAGTVDQTKQTGQFVMDEVLFPPTTYRGQIMEYVRAGVDGKEIYLAAAATTATVGYYMYKKGYVTAFTNSVRPVYLAMNQQTLNKILAGISAKWATWTQYMSPSKQISKALETKSNQPGGNPNVPSSTAQPAVGVTGNVADAAPQETGVKPFADRKLG